MLLTIFNLPEKTRYSDIKSLIHTKCGLKDVILDNLSHADNNSKKVTVGLAEEEDAAILVRKINGLFVEGQQLYVETVTKKQDNNQDDIYKQHARSAYESGTQMQTKMPTLQQPYYQQNSYQQPSHQLGYRDMQQTTASMMASALLSHASVYGASADQNAFANYGYPQQMPYHSTSQVMHQPFGTFDQGAPLGFNNQGNNTGSWSNQNDWKVAGNQNSQQSSSNSRWINPGDSNSRSSRDAASHDHGRDAPSRSYGRDAPRDHGRVASSRDRARDAPARDHGRDVSLRDRGRESRARGRGAPVSHYGRDAPSGDHGRDATYRSNYPNRGPPKQKFSPYDAPAKPLVSYPKIYGDHVTDPSQQVAKFSQQRNRSMPFHVHNKPGANEYFPPVKRQRKDVGFVNQSNEPKANIPINKNKFTPLTKKKNKHKNNPEMFAHRAITWRCQIASSIAKEIISNTKLKNDIDPELFLAELKRGIRYRLETMFGDDFKVRMGDMLKIYRDTYDTKSDEDFYKEVTEEINKHGSYLADEVQTEVPDKTEQEEDQQQAPSGSTNKIPSYPQGDKRLNKLQKKTSHEIFKDEEILLSKLKPNMQKVLDESVDEMCSLIPEEFSEEPEPDYKDFHESIKTSVVEDLKKALKVNFAKRVLNVGPIMLRIFNIPKIISRGKLAPALAEYGVTSLRKSKGKKHGMYIGTCATYEDHDRLCSMKPIIVEGSTVTIKPFQLAGQQEKLSKEQYKMHRKNMTRGFVDAEEDEEDLDEDDEADEDNILENEEDDNKETGENEDNENDDEQQEINENEDEENAEIDETKTVETKGNEEIKEKNNLKLIEENVACVIKNENNTEKVENSEEASDKPKGIEGNVDETPHVEDEDLTADVKKENSFEIAPSSGKISVEMDKELKPENFENFEDRKDYEDIDIDDVHEDDLEDWV